MRFRLHIPAPCFLVGDLGPDYPSVQLTPNSKGQSGALNPGLLDTGDPQVLDTLSRYLWSVFSEMSTGFVLAVH